MSLTGKRIIILGGSSGIGLATARAAQRDGAFVVIASSRREKINRALTELPGAEGHVLDLGNENAVQTMFSAVGTFDHLVFTAGEPLARGPVTQMDLEMAKGFFQTRYWGALLAVKHGSPGINPNGSIVLTSGTASRRPSPGMGLGASVCGAIEALTRTLALELAPIRVNVVIPGLVDTSLWDTIAVENKAVMIARRSEQLPVKHVAVADEIAGAYLYLMSQGYVTGQSIIVDGGAVLI